MSLDAAIEGVVDVLYSDLPHYSWVGIYLVEGEDLVLRTWRGPASTEHVRIPIGHGICGWAAQMKQTAIVDDVSKDERYLMCFPHMRSEVVVPIMKSGRIYGEIDIDGGELAAFGVEDERFLEEVAAKLASLVALAFA